MEALRLTVKRDTENHFKHFKALNYETDSHTTTLSFPRLPAIPSGGKPVGRDDSFVIQSFKEITTKKLIDDDALFASRNEEFKKNIQILRSLQCDTLPLLAEVSWTSARP